eukprot:10030426-Heterocapsa_arctica.AAC.1
MGRGAQAGRAGESRRRRRCRRRRRHSRRSCGRARERAAQPGAPVLRHGSCSGSHASRPPSRTPARPKRAGGCAARLAAGPTDHCGGAAAGTSGGVKRPGLTSPSLAEWDRLSQT